MSHRTCDVCGESIDLVTVRRVAGQWVCKWCNPKPTEAVLRACQVEAREEYRVHQRQEAA